MDTKIDDVTLLDIHRRMVRIRRFEETAGRKMEDGKIPGALHLYVGQEAVAAGCGAALAREDLLGSTHRAHHHFLGKALPFYMTEDYDPSTSDFTEEMKNCVFKTLAEVMGLKSGWCGGRGGSMHLKSAEAGITGTNAIVGGGIALTTGAAWALRMRKEEDGRYHVYPANAHETWWRVKDDICDLAGLRAVLPVLIRLSEAFGLVEVPWEPRRFVLGTSVESP